MTTGPHDMNTKPPPLRETAPPSDTLPSNNLDEQILLALLVFDPQLQFEESDIAQFLEVLKDEDMDDVQKRELIHTLGQLVQTVMQIQLGLDPVSEALAVKELDCKVAQTSMVISDNTSNTNFNAASGEGAPL